MAKVKPSKKNRGRPRQEPSTLKDRERKYKTKITDYDFNETTDWIDPKKPLALEDLGFTLPELPPTQVISIRLPTELLNELRALGSQKDVPYQALIKLFLDEAIQKSKKKAV